MFFKVLSFRRDSESFVIIEKYMFYAWNCPYNLEEGNCYSSKLDNSCKTTKIALIVCTPQTHFHAARK